MNRTLQNRLLLLIAALLAETVSGSALAAVTSRDWKTPGDGLLTYDDVNRREWLDLSVTSLRQFPGANREAQLQYVLNQKLPGGTFEGFTFAKPADIDALALSARIATAILDFAVNEAPTRALTNLLGVTIPLDPDRFYSMGFLDEISAPPVGPPRRKAGVFFVDAFSGANGQAGLIISDSIDGLADSRNGVMLFRSVSEPSPMLLAALSPLSFFVGRRVAITPPGGQPAVRSGYTLTILRKNPDGRWVIARCEFASAGESLAARGGGGWGRVCEPPAVHCGRRRRRPQPPFADREGCQFVGAGEYGVG